MKISYNWLKDYLDIDETTENLDRILTDIGLEVEGVENRESVKGGLKGLVIGEVLEKEKHPNADKLSLTKVNVGGEEPLPIVCGAPNVEAGQKVVVATVGTTLYDDKGSFQIKKSKIRGEVSMGMLCGADEVGLEGDPSGIMVLDNAVTAGTLAKDYFEIEEDYIFEIGLTPNRADAMSHIGVARDLKAYYAVHNKAKAFKKPDLSEFPESNESNPISIKVEDQEACPRYAGLFIEGVNVAESPDWLKTKLESIGLTPKNNIVDITNFVLHEYGQPLHAFDANQIKGDQIVVRKAHEGEKITTLDEVERELHRDDLLICNESEPMCIAGVLGGLDSGVSASTKAIFLESAYFNPVTVRKSAKRHAINTDSSFRFERGIDPNATLEGLKRAALLIQEIAGGKIASRISDEQSTFFKPFEITYNHQKSNELLGADIPKNFVLDLFKELEIEVASEQGENMTLHVPPYRVDVTRPADVSEEILRMYGYNTVEIPSQVKSALVYPESVDIETVRETFMNHLASVGFNEILNNSLSNEELYEDFTERSSEEYVKMLNPLSSELATMRPTLMMEGLKTLAYNFNRQQKTIKVFENGRDYFRKEDNFIENDKLAIWVSGKRFQENWWNSGEQVTFYYLKGIVENSLKRLGINNVKFKSTEHSLLSDGLQLKSKKKNLGFIGKVKKAIAKSVDVSEDVYYAELDWKAIFTLVQNNTIEYNPVPKYPAVRRDLSLLIDKDVTFADLEKVALQSEQNLLKEVGLFDVYEGDKLPEGKKSYALYFVLQSTDKTLKDKVIDSIMTKIQKQFSDKCNAELR